MTKSYEVTSSGTWVSERLLLPPGRHLLNFTSDAQPVNAPGDPRNMVLQFATPKFGL